MSDLHLETRGLEQPQAEDADLVILAGDIDNGIFGIRWALDKFSVPVIYVPGNHEFYDNSRTELLVKMRMLCQDSHVHLLEQDSLAVGEFRFLGTTLWTDFAVAGNQRQSMNIAQHYMMDFRCIEVTRGEPFTCQRALELHQRSLAWLRSQLQQTDNTSTVVISHHAPSPRSIASKYRGSALNPAFVSNLEALICEHDIALWIHGHTHTAFDYSIGDTRVVCNPRGYLPYETNTGYQQDMIIQIGADNDR